MDDFCSLSRYAQEDVDTDAKRKEKFLNGLKGELKIPLSVAYTPNYQALLDQAITLDDNLRKEENRKRKHNQDKLPSGSHQKPHHAHGDSNIYKFNKHADNNHHNGYLHNLHEQNRHHSHGSNSHTRH